MTTPLVNDVPVIKEVTINAPASKVWEALTDKHKMKEWYFDIAEFEPKVGFEFTFSGKDKEGKEKVHLCKITEVVPNKKLQHTWRYKGFEGDSLVTWELTEEDGKTHVKLTHTGLASFGDVPAFARENFNMGWTQIVETWIKNYVENH